MDETRVTKIFPGTQNEILVFISNLFYVRLQAILKPKYNESSQSAALHVNMQPFNIIIYLQIRAMKHATQLTKRRKR